MIGAGFHPLHAGEAVPLRAVPVLPIDDFREGVLQAVEQGRRIVALFGVPRSAQHVRLYAVLADDRRGGLAAGATDVGDAYPALTPDCPQAHWFEREIAEQWGVRPEGHPWLKPIRFHRAWTPDRDAWRRPASDPILPGVTDYFCVEGEEIHEVAVGPVHAGVIEPGHFRFQCHGENVLHLEISLGYQHRGVERALVGGPSGRALHYFETLAGDTTIGHTTAYAHVIEALSGASVPVRAEALRAMALELERLANHTGDLGALAGDVGYLPTASYCGRLRGDFLNMTALLCGSRFGRGLVEPGGVRFDAEPARIEDLVRRLDQALRDVNGAVDMLWSTPSVLARFEETGALTQETCQELGLVGPAARASGLERDVRQDFPAGMYRFHQIPVSTWHTGDVFGRAFVRWLEIQRSVAFVKEQADMLPAGATFVPPGPPAAESMVVTLVEGWRGEICHVALTDAAGLLARYKIVDPSFHNWIGLAIAMRGQQISDFPLCNKSFSLSYCGHDL